MPKKIAFCYFVTLFFACVPATRADSILVLSKSVSHYMGGRVEVEAITNQFDCRDRIYATYWGEKKSNDSKENVTFEWINPSDDTELIQKAQVPDVNRGVSKWLALTNRNSPSLTGYLNLNDGYAKFIGEWKIKIKVDSVQSATQKFDILC